MTKFYVVEDQGFDDRLFAYGEQKTHSFNVGEAPRCEFCGGRNHGMLRWLPPLDVRVSKKKLGDVIFGTFETFLVSAKFKEWYEHHQLTGITEFRPVTIYFRRERLEVSYYTPTIAFSRARVDFARSHLIYETEEHAKKADAYPCQKTSVGLKSMKGIVFQNPEVITDDIFRSTLHPATFFTTYAKNLAKAAGLTNLQFVPAENYIPCYMQPKNPRDYDE